MRSRKAPKSGEEVQQRTSVSSIGQFVDWVETVGTAFTTKDGYEAPWFRGAGCAGHGLLPGLYRTEEGRKPGADDELRYEFARKALPLVADRAPRDGWEWYFLMQHYRAPTRLLDWTDSALVALYFALISWNGIPCVKGTPPLPAVWALNPFALNRWSGYEGGPVGAGWQLLERYLPEPYESNRIPPHPVALDPTFAAQRMLVQHSHFTLHGSDMRSLDALLGEAGLQESLLQVTLDFELADIDYYRWHLTLLGITETTVFPDLEGLARELRLEYKLDVSRSSND